MWIMVADKMADMVVDEVADMVVAKVADMEVDKVADMEVDKVTDMEVDRMPLDFYRFIINQCKIRQFTFCNSRNPYCYG